MMMTPSPALQASNVGWDRPGGYRTATSTTPSAQTRPASQFIAEDTWDMEDMMLRQYALDQQQQKIAGMRRRFINVDIPLALFASGTAYGAYKAYNTESRVVQDLLSLSRHRDAAQEVTKWLVNNSYQRNIGQNLLHTDSAGTLGRLQMALSIGASPEEMAEPVRRLKVRNPNSVLVQKIEQEVQGYGKSFQRVVSNISGLEKLSIPLVSKTLGISNQETKTLVRENPHRFIKELLSKGLTDPRYNEGFFKKLFSELNRANRLMAGIVAASVGISVVGLFLTRLEVAIKRSHA